RLAGDHQQYDERSGSRLSRCRPPTQGRRRPDDRPQRSQGLARQAVRTESGMKVFNGMKVLDLFPRRSSTTVATARHTFLLAYERAARGQSDLLAVLREDILAALTKHITVERQNVQVRMDRGESVSTLEIEVEIPNSTGMLLATGT